MKLARLGLATAVVGALTLGCGDGDEEECLMGPPDISTAELAGTWNATVASFSSLGNPPEVVDIIAQGGSATFTIMSNGRFTFSATLPGEPSETITGLIVVECRGELTIIDDDAPNDPDFATFTLSGNSLQLSVEAEFDFNGDGIDEPAFLFLELQRT